MDSNEQLNPLLYFYAEEEVASLEIHDVPTAEIPEPYRTLLVHNGDMTPALEAYHRESIHLKVLKKHITNRIYSRKVLLLLNSTNVPVEFGGIRIYLERFPSEAQQLIVLGNRPLGTILNHQKIHHSSRPISYIRLISTQDMIEGLQLSGPQTLYGRCNVIRGEAELPLAEIVEILPSIPPRRI